MYPVAGDGGGGTESWPIYHTGPGPVHIYNGGTGDCRQLATAAAEQLGTGQMHTGPTASWSDHADVPVYHIFISVCLGGSIEPDCGMKIKVQRQGQAATTHNCSWAHLYRARRAADVCGGCGAAVA